MNKTLVKFKVPGLNGMRTIAGTVVRVLPSGKLEVRAQDGGYHTIAIVQVLS